MRYSRVSKLLPVRTFYLFWIRLQPCMNRIQRLAILSALIILSTPLYSGAFYPARAASAAFIDPDLANAINSGASQVKFVVTYDHPPTASDKSFLNGLGLAALFVLHQLPMALVVGTPSQALAIASQRGIVSLWNDTPQAYYSQVTKPTTTTERCRSATLGGSTR